MTIDEMKRSLGYIAGLNKGLLVLYINEKGEETLRSFDKSNNYPNVQFNGSVEEFLIFSSNVKEKGEKIINEAHKWAAEQYTLRRKRVEYARGKLQTWKSSLEGANIPGYSLNGKGIREVKSLIAMIDSEKEREDWKSYFRGYGIEEYIRRELQIWKNSLESANIPGYLLNDTSMEKIKSLIAMIDSEKEREIWKKNFQKCGIEI